MTPRHIVMAVALAVAAWLALFGDKTPSSGIAEPVAHPASAPARAPAPSTSVTVSNAAEEKSKSDTVILTLKNREQLMGGTGSAADSRPDALFKSQSWTPPPPPPPPPAPPPNPTAPPLPFKYMGKKIEDGKWEVYVTIGNQVYVAREKTVLQGTYRIDSIKPPVLSLTYLPLQQVQTLTIGGID